VTAQANSRMISCQYALIALYRLRPYSDYKPRLNDEFKEEFITRRETENVLAITVYEEVPGQFIVASTEDDYARYELYKSQAVPYARCLVVGSFTKAWAVEPLDKPFCVALANYDPYVTAHCIAKRLKKLQHDRKVSTFTLMQVAGLTIEDYTKLSDPIRPQAPTIDTLERIAKVLGVSSSDILPF
jgi:DNA-binding Xre family transcriptional regulator